MTRSHSHLSIQPASKTMSVGFSFTTTVDGIDEAPRNPLQPGSGRPAAENAGSHHVTRQQRSQLRRLGALGDVFVELDAGQHEIIDDAGGAIFVIEQLAVQQMEPGVDQLTAVMNDR